MRKKIFTFLLALVTSVGLSYAATDGKLSGAFSVASGTQVYFSQGNLQYQASTNTWRFAEHQYDIIGDAAGNTTVSGRDAQSDWIDLFGWATSGNSASGTAYQPWTNSADHSEYGPSITSGDWTYANSDWGINPISNGGNTAGSWRTLSQAEWNYLLFDREGNRFAYARLNIGGNYIYGLIILPDDWNTSYYALGSINETNHSYDSNQITAENWTNSLEAHGAVFLPITGSRNEDQIYGIDGEDSYGLYWSSTAGEYYEEFENEFEPEQPIVIDIKNAAYALQFNGGYYIRNNVTRRATGVAVRLVYTEPSGDPTPTPKYFYMEVEGTAGTLKYGDKGSNPYYYESGAWHEGAFKSSITAITVDASCQNFDGKSLQSLFNSFSSLTSISGLENINTANVTNMQNTFSGNEQLTSLDLSSWNTANLENMSAIFIYCSKLVTLDISSWNTAKVTNMYYAFGMCPKLEHIYVGDEWSTASVSNSTSMFASCPKLPNYNEDVVDKTKAYAGEGGYLEYKAGSTPDPDPQDPDPTPSGDDKLLGVFSISSTETVNFSKGNLQYVGGNWQFAENQWDVIGASQINSSRDLFGWGTGNNPNQTSEEYEDYTTFADWGSNMDGDWRTLTRDEWLYIFNTRTSASDLRGSATVCGVHGYIILPDNFVLPGGLSWTPRPNNWTTNVYTSQEWSSMEENGAVFLPAAGYREGTTVRYNESSWGYYWSATDHPYQYYYACIVWVADEDNSVRVDYRDRTYGHSVRLVKNASSGGSTPAVDPAVQNVIDLINAIPNPVVYNQECFNALNAVFNAYVALSEEQRDQVTNYDDYLAAEERYYMLGSVNGVIEAINDIGDVEFTSACKHKIDYARSEYCNLTLEAKGYVTNYNTLLAAEAAYAALIPVSSTVVWDEAILETIDVDEWDVTTFTNGSLSLKAVDGHAYYVDGEQHFLFDGSNSEKSFVFSCTSANILCIEITVSEKHEHNELSCAWQETATGYRWVGEATSVDLASTIFKVTGIRFSLGEAFPEPTPTPAQDGDKLPGAFSVSGEKVVYFSKGNLQYLGNIDRWHFAENQWTIIGNAQASNNRDLFSWGTGDNPDSEDYSTYTEWGNNIEGNWRTLTVDEWTYLFNTRTDASSKYGTATVAGVVGLILLPDVYDGTAINTDRTAWDNNVISSSEWAAYEAAGAVFLPAAGLSDAYGVYGVGEQGFYWSSTMDALSHDAIAVFYGFDYWEGYWFNQVDAQFQPQGHHSVRLVSETAPTPVGPTYIDADFAIDFMSDPYTVVGGGALPTGVEVEGSMNTGDAQHGYRLPVITIPVTAGNYKVMMGTCSYSNQDATVKTEDNSYTYATLETNNGTCYHQNTATNVVGAIFNVPSDQIIKVYGAEYTPFFSIEKMAAVPAFTDFEINFMSDPYGMISGAKPEGTVIAGSFHDGQHGYQNVEATVPVKAGKYRLTLGACGYGNGAGNVMSETNVELASFNQKLAENDKCYHQDPANNIVSMIFDIDQDQTITIDCGQYTPYMKLEAVTAYQVSFALSDAEGTVPAAVDVTVGEGITMPVNKTMYKEGYTLTGWSDGVNTYPIGESFTPANDVVLTPVFTANEADLLNASTDVTVKWYFGGDNGAPTTSYEGTSGLLVAQATIGDKTVDVKLAIDATSGKFAPQPTTEWAQVRVGTIFTYPYKEGMTVDVHTYSGNVTYYLADGNVTCGTNDYYSFIEVTYPASAPTTAVVIGDPNNVSEVETFLTNYNGQTIDELIIDRPVLNNMYNTLCLPFDMNAAQIAASSLNGVEIREFTGASVEGTTLNLSVGDPVNAVVAGRPYFVKYSAATQLDDLHFEDVTINNALLDNMAVTFDGVTFKGTFTPFIMPNGLNFQGGYLFLGQNNQLFWPNTSNPLKPFRAYFYVDVESSTPGNAPKYRGMPARIVEGKNVATGVENTNADADAVKVLRNGQLIIIRNGVEYSIDGKIVK